MFGRMTCRTTVVAVELVAICLLTVAAYFLAGSLEAFEWLHERMKEYDGAPQGHLVQADELFVVSFFLTMELCLFAWRRWWEIRRLLKERDQTLEDLQVAKELAESSNRAKGEFLANMSHEIRTPMNAIIGMTDLVLDSPLSDQQRENLEIVRTSSQSLLQIINDILDFSKIEAGKLELDSVEFDLSTILGDTIKSMCVRANEKSLELACRIAPGTPQQLIGDPLRLRQVLVNLIGNAIKFTQQGEVVVNAESEPMSQGQVRIHFSVRDTGIGISSQHQQKIFEAFTQADGSSTRRYGGTGLGLAISTRIVSLMGGHIWVDSEYGKGSTFHFTAVFRENSRSSPSPPPGVAHLRNLRVLIVDDNATNRLILEEAVTAWAMRPSSVDNGTSAIDALRSAAKSGQPFALMLLDAMMPDTDGFDVARRCRRDLSLRGTTIMMLSSADSDGDAARCRELGIARYLRKPITVGELQTAVLAALGTAPAKNNSLSQPMPSDPSTSHRLNILLAEDNVINQRVAVSILEKRGHVVQPVNNGVEALEALACERFDVVLMDVQMPEMDGLEATAAIRRNEQGTSQHIPIIAMTAHAMKGDRERCLEAGMDDYLAKPVEPKALDALLLQWCSSPRGALDSSQHDEGEEKSASGAGEQVQRSDLPPPTKVPIPANVFDIEALRARVENDLDLLAEMIDLYLSSSPLLMTEIESAVDGRDSAKIARAAHTLKGALKNMCASACADAALNLERDATEGDHDQIAHSLDALKHEFHRLHATLIDVSEGAKK